jgi:hypothetical protein
MCPSQSARVFFAAMATRPVGAFRAWGKEVTAIPNWTATKSQLT